MVKKFKKFVPLTKERTKELNKLFKTRIEIYEWQHQIRWCHKYGVTKEECKVWLATNIANHAKTPKNVLDYVQYCLGEYGKKYELTEIQIDLIKQCIENNDTASQIAFNILNTINFGQIELVSIEEDYFIKN
jgi:hypothetical protein